MKQTTFVEGKKEISHLYDALRRRLFFFQRTKQTRMKKSEHEKNTKKHKKTQKIIS